MPEGLQDRARNLLATSTLSLRSWALGRLIHVLESVAARTPEPARQTAQRFGTQLWKRITARFPTLEGLLDPIDSEHPFVPATGTTAAATTTTTTATTIVPTVQQVARVHEAQKTSDVSALLRALRDPSAEVAAAAAVALSTSSDAATESECRAALLEVLTNAEGYFNPITRVAALQALLPRLSPSAEPELLQTIVNAVRDVDAEVSMAAIAAVAQRAPATMAVNALLPVAQDDSGFYLPMVKTAATNALERAGLWSERRATHSWSQQ